MSFGDYGVVRNQEQQRQKVDQIRENAARQATFQLTYTTTGNGELIVPELVTFDCTFSEMPHVSTGCRIIKADPATQYGLPRVTAGVYSWKTELKPGRDGRDPSDHMYVGCNIYFIVDTPLPDNAASDEELKPSKCQVEHFMRFDGIAMKQLPGNITSGL